MVEAIIIGESFSGKSILIGVAFNMERHKSDVIVKLTWESWEICALSSGYL